MRLSNAAHFAFIFGSVALLAGCGAPQPSVVPSIALPQGVPATRQHHHGISWMGKGLQQRDLVYVTNANGVVNVYTYWQHTLVGVLTNFTKPLGECADRAGNVYIVDNSADNIAEYAHGGKKPINVLKDPTIRPYGCAVTPTASDVAVANYGDFYYSGAGNIAVYPHGSGKPTIYQGSGDDHFTSCGYDDRGDLLATSEYGNYSYYTHFYYLPKGGTKLLPINLPGPNSSGWEYVQAIAWDGKYWVVVSYDSLYRYAINIKAQHIDTLTLYGGYGDALQVAIYRKGLKSQGTQLVGGATTQNNQSGVYYWKYPAGGYPIFQITKDLDVPYGVAISLGKH